MNKEMSRVLIEAAFAIRKNSYSPYSNYPVGCAVLVANGQIITGVNIENASYPVGICAERAAMAQVISLGLKDAIEALAVVTSSSPPASPCGMCRQFLLEFLGPKTPVFLANHKDEVVQTSMAELLPAPFQKAHLT